MPRRRARCSAPARHGPDGRDDGPMSSEQRRTGRWRVAVVLMALVVTGCGGSPDGTAQAPVVDGVAMAGHQAGAAVDGDGGRSAASLPDELVGSWAADDPQGVGS